MGGREFGRVIREFHREDGKIRLKAFHFSVVFRGMTEWWNRAVAEEKVRAVLDKYAQFNATMHDADS